MKTSQKIKQNVVNNLAKTTLYENVTELLRMQQIYEAGIKEVRTKLEILDAEFKVKHDHNPIHHIESRLKSPESILKKAISKDIPVTERSLEENIHAPYDNYSFEASQVKIVSNDGYNFNNYDDKKMILKPIINEKLGHRTHTRDPKVWKYNDNW